MSKGFSKEERSWILYDVGNSAFSLTITTTIYTLFFNTLGSQAGLLEEQTTGAVGFINSFAFLLVAVLSPILGTFADYKGQKKRFFSFFAFMGIVSVLALMLVGRGQWIMAAIIYNVATLGYTGSNIFYNSFLMDVSPKSRLDKVSSAGFAWGYIGSTIPFLVSLGIIFAFFNGPEGISMKGYATAFIITAIWWLIFTLPTLFNVKQVHGLAPSPTPVRDTFKRLWGTIKKIRLHRAAFLFLLAYFLYIDGVDTIIVMAMDFGMKNSSLGDIQLVVLILAIQVIAWPSTLIYGRLAKSVGTRKMLYVGIGTYCIITLIAGFMESIPKNMVNAAFIGIAVLVGTAQGGIQALSRSYFGSLIPPDNSAEFFGFFNIFGKFAAIFGPAVIGLFSLVMKKRILMMGPFRFTGYSIGVLFLLVFFIAGGLLLRFTQDDSKADA